MKNKIKKEINVKNLRNLLSVWYAIDMTTGIVYTKEGTGRYLKHIDFSKGIHVTKCTDEWFSRLSDEDRKIVNAMIITGGAK